MLRLYQASGCWPLQPLELGVGSVNFDYFPVVIRKLPHLPGQTRPATPQEFFNYWRLNVNQFVNPKLVRFEPHDTHFAKLWESGNCFSSVLVNLGPQIQASREIVGELGKHFDPSTLMPVVVSELTPTSWTFSTLWTPRGLWHIFSGHRQFGYFVNPPENIENPEYVFYTRSVHRLSGILSLSMEGIPAELMFKGAEKAWRSTQKYLCDFVNQNHGVAEITGTLMELRPWEEFSEAKAKL